MLEFNKTSVLPQYRYEFLFQYWYLQSTYKNIFFLVTFFLIVSTCVPVYMPCHVFSQNIDTSAVLNSVNENLEISTGQVVNNLNNAYFLVWRIPHYYLLYPYHIQRVQTLFPRDIALRVSFCRWLIQKVTENPLFDREISLTIFTKNRIRNFHNHFWAEENPHSWNLTTRNSSH